VVYHRGVRARLLLTIAVLAAGCSYHGRDTGDAASGQADSPPGTIDAPYDAPFDARPPDAAVDARVCPSAPSGCVAFTCGTASCYYACAARTWSAAQTRCQTAGVGCLATINDDAENLCITAATNPVFPDLVWFGFVQATGSVEPGGGWGWTCGSSSYTAANWGMFEPNDSGGNEDCGALNAGGVWIDGDCGTSLRFVCELP